jgi:NTP pyrophosphatase (non-canonical NTP hydrolase)
LKTVFEKILENAKTFEVPMPDKPTNQGIARATAFRRVLVEECDELTESIDSLENEVSLINYADTLADIVVYCMTEAVRWGIPFEPILHAVIDSQRSKLVEGKPLWAPDKSKYLKGPDFAPPEPEIAAILTKAEFYGTFYEFVCKSEKELRWGFFENEEGDFTIHEAIPTDEGGYEFGKLLLSVPTVILARMVCDNHNKYVSEPK